MRDIKPKMLSFLDLKLKNHGAAQAAIKEKDARSLFIYAGEVCVGVREEGGDNRGMMVQLMQQTLGSAEREPWCMSFIQTCLAYAEKKTGLISPVFDSEHVLTVWNKTKKSARVQTFPLGGAIVIWQHGASTSGHTGIFVEPLSKKIMLTIEGNTTAGVDKDGNIEREGGGIYQNQRSLIKNGTMKVLGFLKPF